MPAPGQEQLSQSKQNRDDSGLAARGMAIQSKFFVGNRRGGRDTQREGQSSGILPSPTCPGQGGSNAQRSKGDQEKELLWNRRYIVLRKDGPEVRYVYHGGNG